MNICIPGGASYIGAALVPKLLAEGHNVTVYDTLFFGSGYLPQHDNLKVIKADMRNQEAWKVACKDQDAVIYLASISRELLCQEKPEVANAINVECFKPAVQIAKDAGIKRFIYASSVAVYGSNDHPAVEDERLAPTTIYGMGKAACEAILWMESSRSFCVAATRSASVCGYSPRQRLDLTLNRMVHDACRKGFITVEGGDQIRSHVHIKDLCDFYQLLLNEATDIINGEAFNVVAENQTVLETATIVANAIRPVRRAINKPFINVMPRVDDRSYSISGAKAREILKFSPQWLVRDAVEDLRVKFEAGYWPDAQTNPMYLNMAEIA